MFQQYVFAPQHGDWPQRCSGGQSTAQPSGAGHRDELGAPQVLQTVHHAVKGHPAREKHMFGQAAASAPFTRLKVSGPGTHWLRQVKRRVSPPSSTEHGRGLLSNDPPSGVALTLVSVKVLPSKV